MKRTPLRRSTPLRRKAWRKQRGDTKYRRRPRDGAYMGWVRWQSCCARVFAQTPCYGNVEADHAGRRGIGQKADDRTCIPLCRNHHRERTDFSGAFKGWTQNGMRVWLNIMIEKHQTRYDEQVSSGNRKGVTT